MEDGQVFVDREGGAFCDLAKEEVAGARSLQDHVLQGHGRSALIVGGVLVLRLFPRMPGERVLVVVGHDLVSVSDASEMKAVGAHVPFVLRVEQKQPQRHVFVRRRTHLPRRVRTLRLCLSHAVALSCELVDPCQVLQSLLALGIQQHVTRARVQDDPLAVPAQLVHIRQHLARTLRQLLRLGHGLEPGTPLFFPLDRATKVHSVAREVAVAHRQRARDEVGERLDGHAAA